MDENFYHRINLPTLNEEILYWSKKIALHLFGRAKKKKKNPQKIKHSSLVGNFNSGG